LVLTTLSIPFELSVVYTTISGTRESSGTGDNGLAKYLSTQVFLNGGTTSQVVSCICNYPTK